MTLPDKRDIIAHERSRGSVFTLVPLFRSTDGGCFGPQGISLLFGRLWEGSFGGEKSMRGQERARSFTENVSACVSTSNDGPASYYVIELRPTDHVRNRPQPQSFALRHS